MNVVLLKWQPEAKGTPAAPGLFQSTGPKNRALRRPTGFASGYHGNAMMKRLSILLLILFAVPCWAEDKPTHYTYVQRNLSKPGDYKVVTVPATTPRQAMLDAQTYHIGWDAVDAWMGQSRVMHNVLLKKREPYIPGAPRVVRPIQVKRQPR